MTIFKENATHLGTDLTQTRGVLCYRFFRIRFSDFVDYLASPRMTKRSSAINEVA